MEQRDMEGTNCHKKATRAQTVILKRLNTLETTQGHIDGLFSQLPFKCYLPEVAFVGD